MSNTDVPGISLHDFNNVEGRRLWGFLNIKEEGLFPRTPFLDRDVDQPVVRDFDSSGVSHLGFLLS